MVAQFKKGDWKLTKKLGIYVVYTNTDQIICSIGDCLDEKNLFNGLLIAHAPDLIEAASRLVCIPADPWSDIPKFSYQEEHFRAKQDLVKIINSVYVGR